MKEKTIFLIDGENISYKKADQIDAITVQIENVTDRKVYHRWGTQLHVPGRNCRKYGVTKTFVSLADRRKTRSTEKCRKMPDGT